MATMKTSVGRLYMLFNACLPENEKVKKRLIISEILESKEYTKLKAYAPFKNIFEQYFSANKIGEYSIEKLNEIIKVIPRIIPLIENIVNSINYGNALELTEKDIPDYTSLKSLEVLNKKLRINQANPNVTNITINNFMDIFSDKTIKDPTEVLKTITEDDIKNPIEAVRRKLSQNTYCIKAKDISDIKNNYAEKVSNIESKLVDIKNYKWGLRYKKCFFIGIAVSILTVVNTFELLSQGVSISLISFSTLLLTTYFFIG